MHPRHRISRTYVSPFQCSLDILLHSSSRIIGEEVYGCHLRHPEHLTRNVSYIAVHYWNASSTLSWTLSCSVDLTYSRTSGGTSAFVRASARYDTFPLAVLTDTAKCDLL